MKYSKYIFNINTAYFNIDKVVNENKKSSQDKEHFQEGFAKQNLWLQLSTSTKIVFTYLQTVLEVLTNQTFGQIWVFKISMSRLRARSHIAIAKVKTISQVIAKL